MEVGPAVDLTLPRRLLNEDMDQEMTRLIEIELDL